MPASGDGSAGLPSPRETDGDVGRPSGPSVSGPGSVHRTNSHGDPGQSASAPLELPPVTDLSQGLSSRDPLAPAEPRSPARTQSVFQATGTEGAFTTPGRSRSGLSNRAMYDMMHSAWERPLSAGRWHGTEVAPTESGAPEASHRPQSSVGGASALGGHGADGMDNMTIWGTNIVMGQVVSRLERFVRQFNGGAHIPAGTRAKYEQLVWEAVRDGQTTLHVDCRDLRAFDITLHDQLVAYPTEVVPQFDMVVYRIAQDFALELHGAEAAYLQVRPFGLHEHRPLRDLDPKDIDKLVSVRGMITRCSAVIPDLRTAFFRCYLCGATATALNDNGQVAEPSSCSHCSRSFTMEIIHNRSQFSSKQLLKVQEVPEDIPEGETPHAVTVYAHDDLVDSVKPGDRVEIVGVFCASGIRVNPRVQTLRSVYKTFVDAIHIRKESSAAAGLQALSRSAVPGASSEAVLLEALRREGTDLTEDRIREKELRLRAVAEGQGTYERLVRSLAPSIFGMDDVKKGVLCQLFGGVSKTVAGGRIRGDINCLLVGDPGVSKSQLLGYVHQVAPRGIYTSGRGSSAVGLTAYVTRDPDARDMVLESGALVLSDLGVCCIDEFDKMSDSARSILHEVMEQQTVSVAKAGIISTLNARTSVLAAANPVGSRYNRSMSIVENLQLPPTLLSRFDLIYLLLDKNDEWEDRRLARHLTSLYYDNPPERHAPPLTKEELRDYIAYARAVCQPVLSDDAAKELVEAYVDMRRTGQDKQASTRRITATARQLESLVRLSEARARMELRSEVTPDDVREAVRLVKTALMDSATDKYGRIDMDLITGGLGQAQREELAQLGQQILSALKATGFMPVPEVLRQINNTVDASSTVSKAQVDEALKTLQLDGKVEIRPHGVKLVAV